MHSFKIHIFEIHFGIEWKCKYFVDESIEVAETQDHKTS